MGKKNGTSWLTIVKRAFRSPTKENQKRSCRRREEEYEQEDEEKNREKRRWLFRKPSSDHVKHCEEKTATNTTTTPTVIPILAADQRHAIAVAAATAAAAEAAVATAQAAVEIVRLTRPSSYVKEHYAATLIQTAFRGYLGRRALRALKGLVKLQALVRGQNARKKAKLTLKCMQAVVRAQDRMRYQRARLSDDGSRKSMFAEISGLWETTNLQDIKTRKSTSKNPSCTIDDWDNLRPHSSQGIDCMFPCRKEASLKREKALAYAFSNQIWRSRRNPSAGDEKDLEERTKWLDRWMATKQWDTSITRASTDIRDNVKTVEIDISRPSSYSAQTLQKQPRPHSISSPLHRAQQSLSLHQSPATPSPHKIKPLQVRSASPRCLKEERSYSAAQTPGLSSTYCINGGISHFATGTIEAAATSTMPNYMAATESAKARARSQSSPRQRPSTPQKERGRSVKKRLSYPAPELQRGLGAGCSTSSQSLGSTSFKSLHGGYSGMGQLSNYSSCFTESFGGEISPSLSGSRFSFN